MEEVNVKEAIEMLYCAEMNCDNGPALGLMGFQAVKLQIQQALIALGKQPQTENLVEKFS